MRFRRAVLCVLGARLTETSGFISNIETAASPTVKIRAAQGVMPYFTRARMRAIATAGSCNGGCALALISSCVPADDRLRRRDFFRNHVSDHRERDVRTADIVSKVEERIRRATGGHA